MKKILILGSLPKEKKDYEIYESIVSACKDFAEEVLSPIDTVNFQGTESERYDRAFETVKAADLIIGEQSTPSTGQGMEIREAINLNKPLIVVAKEGSSVSGLVKACPILKEIIYYQDIKELESSLKKILLKF